MGRAFAVSNVTARNVMINGFLELGRTSYGTVEVKTRAYGLLYVLVVFES